MVEVSRGSDPDSDESIFDREDLLAKAQGIYDQLEPSDSPTRRKSSPHGEVVATRIKSEQQDAYLFQVDGWKFYLDANGIKWVTLPQISVKLGLQIQTLPLQNQTVDLIETSSQMLAIDLLYHVESRIQGQLVIFPPIEANLAKH